MSQNLCSTNLIGFKKIGLKQHSITVNKNCFSPKGESNWVIVSVVTFSPMTNFSADLMLNHRRYVRSTDRRTNNRVVKAVSIVPSSHARCRHTWRNLKKVTRAILDYFLLCVKKYPLPLRRPIKHRSIKHLASVSIEFLSNSIETRTYVYRRPTNYLNRLSIVRGDQIN